MFCVCVSLCAWAPNDFSLSVCLYVCLIWNWEILLWYFVNHDIIGVISEKSAKITRFEDNLQSVAERVVGGFVICFNKIN